MNDSKISTRKRNSLEAELSEIDNQIVLLNDFSNGIDDLAGSKTRYTFNPTRSQINQAKTSTFEGDLYHINYQSRNEGNLVHETTHAIQVDRMTYGRSVQLSPIQMEVGAYSTQYSYNPDTMPQSDCPIIPSSRISPEWIRQIYYFNNGKIYPYAKYN